MILNSSVDAKNIVQARNHFIFSVSIFLFYSCHEEQMRIGLKRFYLFYPRIDIPVHLFS